MIGLSVFNPWVILGIVLMTAASTTAGYLKGRADADRAAEIAALQAKITATTAAMAEMQRQLNAATSALDRAREREEEADLEAEKARALIGAYEQELSARKAPLCILDDADLERLRQLDAGRPAAPAGQPSAAPVPAR